MILPIVEGYSEVEAVPVLLRRLLARLDRSEVRVAKPFRVQRYKVVKDGELERAVIQGIRSREGVTSVLVLLDAEDDDPSILEPALSARCRLTTPLPSAVVLACRELEAWFLGCKDALRGVRGIKPDARAPERPEEIRGAKERLTSNMIGRRYLEVDDQPVFAAQMDLELSLSRCPSFQSLASAVARLVEESC